jgi:hypothetical protein
VCVAAVALIVVATEQIPRRGHRRRARRGDEYLVSPQVTQESTFESTKVRKYFVRKYFRKYESTFVPSYARK